MNQDSIQEILLNKVYIKYKKSFDIITNLIYNKKGDLTNDKYILECKKGCKNGRIK